MQDLQATSIDHVWQVFMPHRLSYSNSGYLVGWVWPEEHLICLTGVILLDDYDNEDGLCQHCCQVNQKKELQNTIPRIIGSWTVNEDERIDRTLFCTKKEWLELELLHPHSLTARVYTDLTKDDYSCSTCILFDPDDLQKSYYIQELAHSESDSPQLTSELPCPVIKIVQMVHKHSSLLTHWENDHSMTGYFIPSSCLDTSVLDWIATLFILPLQILCFLLPTWLFHVNNEHMKKILSAPAFMRVLQAKHFQIRPHLQGKTKSPLKKLSYFNLGCRQMADSILGVGCLFLVSNLASSEEIASLILSKTQSTVTSLSAILNWIMGAPAGLKLNYQLNLFLGSFFKYNIYVWTTYLSVVLEPILSLFLTCCLMSGILGFTLQLSLLQDIISLLTLHIYCFYVFASRLYYFQVYALSSLWRLFRGKKWNMLRQRVDTASYDIDRLFIGTLFFTIFLFLLPTTMVYYTLFTALQLIILALQSCLSTLREFVNSVPVYSLLQWIMRAKTVAGHVIFRVHSSEESPNCTLGLAMQVSHFSVRQVINQCAAKCTENDIRKKPSIWSGIVPKVIKGHLIWKSNKKKII